jgi:hypothetical protein
MPDPRRSDDDYRRLALEALAVGDGRAAHAWAKGWIGSGGGAWILDPWLVYVASALLVRQPRNAVHSTDIALRHWISDPPDRSILPWVRGASSAIYCPIARGGAPANFLKGSMRW